MAADDDGQIKVRLDGDRKRRLRLEAAFEGCSMQDIVIAALDARWADADALQDARDARVPALVGGGAVEPPQAAATAPSIPDDEHVVREPFEDPA